MCFKKGKTLRKSEIPFSLYILLPANEDHASFWGEVHHENFHTVPQSLGISAKSLIEGPRNKQFVEAPGHFRGKEGLGIKSIVPSGNKKRQGGFGLELLNSVGKVPLSSIWL